MGEGEGIKRGRREAAPAVCRGAFNDVYVSIKGGKSPLLSHCARLLPGEGSVRGFCVRPREGQCRQGGAFATKASIGCQAFDRRSTFDDGVPGVRS